MNSAEFTQLEDELEANELDAKRYRWLRDNGGLQEGRESRGVTILKDGWKVVLDFGYWVTPEELDAAIDASTSDSV